MMTWSLLRCLGRYGHRAWRGTVYRTVTTSASEEEAGRDIWEDAYQREVPRTMEELGALLQQKVNSPPNSRILKVAVVGVPNAGKSTVINTLLNWRVVSVSSKVHTTQVNARAVLNIGNTQVVFLDTPGLVTPEEITKHGLKQNLLKEPELSLQEADMMAVIHDASNHFTRNYLHPRVIRLLALYPSIPSILLLNKVDRTKSKQILLDVTRNLTEGMVGGKKSHKQTKKMEKLSKEVLLRKALLLDEKMERKKRSANIHHNLVENAGRENRIGEMEDWESYIRNSANDSMTREGDLGSDAVNEVRDAGVSGDSTCDISIRDSVANKGALLDRQTPPMEQKLQDSLADRKSWPGFREVFMISALDGLGVDDVRDFFLSSAYPGPWIFNQKLVTDQNPQEIALMTVREKFLDAFPKEIPYTLRYSIEYWDLSQSEVVNLVVRVGCRKRGLQRLVIGGGSVGRVAREAEQELRNTFRTEVRLRINVVYDPMLKKTKAYL